VLQDIGHLVHVEHHKNGDRRRTDQSSDHPSEVTIIASLAIICLLIFYGPFFGKRLNHWFQSPYFNVFKAG
jgi:hypothetical protein